MSSFVIAAAAGLMLGVVDQELFRLELEWDWIPDIGIRRALPFVVIALAMVARGESLPSRGALTVERLPEAYVPRITRGRMVGYGVLLAVAFWLTVFAPFQYRAGMQNSMIGVILALSLVVVTGYVGQISLMQMALAGIGAFSVASFGTQAGMPLFISLPLAVAAGVGFGLIAAIPSLRTRGASLAIVTLASGLAMGEIFFSRPGWFGLDRGVKTTDPPVLFGIEFGPNSDFIFGDGKIPTGRVRAVPAGGGRAVLHLGDAAATGRAWASRCWRCGPTSGPRPRPGVNVAAIKLSAFAISSVFAALGGALIAFNVGTYGTDTFGIFASLTVPRLRLPRRHQHYRRGHHRGDAVLGGDRHRGHQRVGDRCRPLHRLCGRVLPYRHSRLQQRGHRRIPAQAVPPTGPVAEPRPIGPRGRRRPADV